VSGETCILPVFAGPPRTPPEPKPPQATQAVRMAHPPRPRPSRALPFCGFCLSEPALPLGSSARSASR